MKTALETEQVMDALESQHPGADTELHYRTAFELLVATILSAQSTDAGVNQVTPALFARYPNATALARATPAELEPQIHSTGFFRAKSRALIGMATALVQQHGGEVPPDMDALTALPGVGRKTANVVLGHAFRIPGLPVDRHVLRVSNRLGIAEGDDPERVEAHLCAMLPKDRWTRTSDTLILHGRRICKPKPLCAECAAQHLCDYFHALQAPAAVARPAIRKSSSASGRRRPKASAAPSLPPSNASTKARPPAGVRKAAGRTARARKAR